MNVQQQFSLKGYNTFGIDAKARYFVDIHTVEELREALLLEGYPEILILGGGSNMLITGDINALVLHINLKGIGVVREDANEVVIRAMAGENWHKLVLWTLDQGYGGLENLSLIPGNTGTAPIQNIGAYGVELKDTFESCEALEIATSEIVQFSREDCRFGYRDSFFKNEGKGRFILTSVSMRLTKKDHPLHTSYGDIAAELLRQGIQKPTIRDVSNAVIAIRKYKLPDPGEIGNSGSFFKNPVLNHADFMDFQKDHPVAPFYKVSDDSFKVPAGWLIEQCGFKGKRFGDAGVHARQALVLVNYGNATGQEILQLSQKIREEVYRKFAIRITPEVNIIG